MTKDTPEKELGKFVGKTLATIACPPIGGALWGKTVGSRVFGGALGLLTSITLTIVPGITHQSDVYDNPSIKTVEYGNFSNGKDLGLAVAGAFASPPLFFKTTSPMTFIGAGEEDEIKIKGDKVFAYDTTLNRFNLEFPQWTEFEYHGIKYSLMESEEKAIYYSQSLNDYLAKGDILNARATRKMLNEAEADLSIAEAAYRQVYTKLREHIDNMNTEIRELSDTKDIQTPFREHLNKMNSERKELSNAKEIQTPEGEK